jgi:hypothetical protein
MRVMLRLSRFLTLYTLTDNGSTENPASIPGIILSYCWVIRSEYSQGVNLYSFMEENFVKYDSLTQIHVTF